MSAVEPVRLKNSITELDHKIGPDSAPVTLLEYGNFECIDCGRFFPVIKQVRKLLGDNLRFVFRHFPTVKTHPHALRAATAAEAAGVQKKFWEMHDTLFMHQTALEDPHLWNYARRIRLDVEQFGRDMSDATLVQQIEANYDRSLFDEHITGTPTIYINNIRYSGARDLESLLDGIKGADSEHRIPWPEQLRGLRSVLNRLRRH
jgi:formate-nitrite transporter family protein